MSDDVTPVELRAPRGACVMEIEWADGHTGTYPHEILRGFCPCAHCQGHDGPIRFVDGGDLTLDDVQQVGNYAVRLVWADGHQTGIYSFRYLRALCACSSCNEGDQRERSFSRQ